MLGNSNPSFYPRRQQDFSNFPTFTNLQPKTLVTPIKEDNLSNANRSFTIGEKLNFTNLSTKTPQRLDKMSDVNEFFNFKNTGIHSEVKSKIQNQYTPRVQSENQQPLKNYTSQIQTRDKQIKLDNQNIISQNPSTKNRVEKQQNQVSWTKHIALQFKVQQMQRKVNSQQLEIKMKTQKITELQKKISVQNVNQNKIQQLKGKQNSQQTQIKQKNQRIESLQYLLNEAKDKQKKQIQSIQRRYQKLLSDQKARYIQQTSKKDEFIKKLIEKLSDQTKNSLNQQINQYINGILSKHSDLETSLLNEKQNNLVLSNKLKFYQSRESVYEDTRQKQQQILNKMAVQLNFVAGKVSSRNLYNTQSECFSHIINCQTQQINQLRTSYNELQKQYLKLRQFITESTTKLTNSWNDQKINFSKQKGDLNLLIADLGFKLTAKQNENNSLKLKLTSLELKYKNILNQHKSKFQNIHLLFSRKQNSLQDIQEIKAALSQMNLKQCQSCMQNQKLLQNQRQKLSLLVN